MAKQYILSEEDLYHIRTKLVQIKVLVDGLNVEDNTQCYRFANSINDIIVKRESEIPRNIPGFNNNIKPPVTIITEETKQESFRDKLKRGALGGSEIVNITDCQLFCLFLNSVYFADFHNPED